MQQEGSFRCSLDDDLYIPIAKECFGEESQLYNVIAHGFDFLEWDMYTTAFTSFCDKLAETYPKKKFTVSLVYENDSCGESDTYSAVCDKGKVTITTSFEEE